MMSAIVYLTLGGCCADGQLARFYVSDSLAADRISRISRVYVGVHYPTDVNSGLDAGLNFSRHLSAVSRKLHHHDVAEKQA
jgi:hypothetical protein